ncbi:MAG: right-handed parallel beta-helix repeat-containing protein, partial [Planctomycetota bacterium]
INLLYQAGILDSDIDAINHYWDPMEWTYNFGDNEEYILNVDAEGELTIYEFDGMNETVGGSDIKWTLTAWHQTILAGDIIDNGDGTITLQVLPVGTYRPFVNDPPVNNVEVFDGDLNCEVLGYTFTGAIGGIGDGSVLSVNLPPAPTEVWVDDDFDNSTPGWGTTHFATIQDGIDAVAGSTVYIAAGTYAENLVINKQLILQGAGSALTIIDASGGSIGILLEAGGSSAAPADRQTIKDLRIINAALNGIRAYKSGGFNLDHVTLENLVITSSGATGVELHNGTNVSDMIITNCEFVSNGHIGLRTSSGTPLDGLLITDSSFNGNSYGIYFNTNTSNLTILRSTFNNSVGGYVGYMTEAGSLTGFTVEDCEFNGNVVGLMVWNTGDNADITITGSSFQDNDKWGVLIWGDTLTNVLVQDSTVQNNDGLGIGYYGLDFYTYADAMTNVAVHGSVITGHTVGGGVKNRNTVDTAIVDATLNDWGDLSGPKHLTSWFYFGTVEITNPFGSGDAVTDYVLYSPWTGMEGGFVTGGGTIWSEIDTDAFFMTAEGEASFGFVAKYKKGANVPDGNTNFVFEAGDLHFHSSEYDWLVVAGETAKFKGTGTIEGLGDGYKFMLWAGDNDPDVDTFRILIWEGTEEDPEVLVYDNGPNDPITGGNIIIHKEKGNK